MENKNRISVYDFVKLAFALVVVVFIYVLIRPPLQPVPVSNNALPAYPAASFKWEYDTETHELLNPEGVQLYRLSADGSQWQPIIPASLVLQLPGEYRLIQNSARVWQILDTVGAVVSTWDVENFRWVMGILPTATLQRPTATLEASQTATQTQMITTVQPSPTSTPDVSLATATHTATNTCNTKVEPKLTVGKQARVLINLNMHTHPEMVDNVFNATPAGEVVDVLDGPICSPYLGGAYWWWQIRNSRGVTGWSVEATINGAVNFLAPLD